MRHREGNRWWWFAVFGITVLLFGFGIGFAVRGPGPSTQGLRKDRLTHLIRSGEMEAMFDGHKQMLEQMRVDVSPQMLRLMDADPMWKLMRTGMFTKMLEDWQKQVDSMLGRAPPED